MPTYEYKCLECEERFEIKQSFNDEPLTNCPGCGGHLERVIFPVPSIMKGVGWVKEIEGPDRVYRRRV